MKKPTKHHQAPQTPAGSPSASAELLAQGKALHAAGNVDGAEAIYRALLAADPRHMDALMLQGIVHVQRGRREEGLCEMDKAIEVNPGNVDAHYNRGLILQMLGRYEEALASYEKGIAVNPAYVGNQWHKGLLLLSLGRFEEGWKQYEWRWKAKPETVRSFQQPLWLGEESLAHKTILLYAEQGYGDTIQFCRYLPMVEALGAKVILELPTPLMDLVSTLKGSYQPVVRMSPLPLFDFQCPLTSLPLAFKTTLRTIPAGVPYLSADPRKCEEWQARLGAKRKPRVGLMCSGSATHTNDHNRSVALNLLAPLWESGFDFHLLQKDIRPQEAQTLAGSANVTSHADKLESFADTAALIAEMDLVISVDTSVAHLAGALGKPVWVLLPFIPDFRWMLEREDSPWYPTARLFRQPRIGDWAGAIAKVKAALESWRA